MKFETTAQDIAANTVLTLVFLILFGVAIHLSFSTNANNPQPCLEEPQY